MTPLEIAAKLGEAIIESEEYKEFTRAKEAMDESEEAHKLVELFQDTQQAMREDQMMGRKITQEQITELRAHQKRMLDNPEINAYLQSKSKVENLLTAVKEEIARITGMDTGHSHGGGGCSGGCC